MLITEKEEKMIIKLSRRPTLGVCAFLSLFILSAAWVVLIMIDDIALNSSEFYIAGLWVYLILVIFLLYFGLWALLSAKTSLSTPAWKILAERSMEAVGLNRPAVGPEASPKEVAKRLGMTIPSPLRAKLIILIVPSLILLDTFIPEFMSSRTHVQHDVQVAAEALSELQEDLTPYFDSVSVEDPAEYYSDYGYYCIADLEDDFNSDYIYITVENDGVISEIAYNYYLDDMSMTNEEIIEDLNRTLETMHEAVTHITLETGKEDMLTFDPVVPEFEQEFLNGSLYEDIEISDRTDSGMDTFCYFDTRAKDEFTEYTKAMISVSLYSR